MTSVYGEAERYKAHELYPTRWNRTPQPTSASDVYALGCIAHEVRNIIAFLLFPEYSNFFTSFSTRRHPFTNWILSTMSSMPLKTANFLFLAHRPWIRIYAAPLVAMPTQTPNLISNNLPWISGTSWRVAGILLPRTVQAPKKSSMLWLKSTINTYPDIQKLFLFHIPHYWQSSIVSLCISCLVFSSCSLSLISTAFMALIQTKCTHLMDIYFLHLVLPVKLSQQLRWANWICLFLGDSTLNSAIVRACCPYRPPKVRTWITPILIRPFAFCDLVTQFSSTTT